jgi:hypothetical protein
VSVTQHAHQRDHPSAASDEEKRADPVDRGPDEMASDRASQVNRVVDVQLVGKERRHLAVLEAIDGEFQR